MSWQLLFALSKFQTLKRWVSLKPKVNELQFYFLIRKISNLKSIEMQNGCLVNTVLLRSKKQTAAVVY